MKIGVTISNLIQLSQTQYRDVNVTKIFESSSSIDDMLLWAKTVDPNANFHTLLLSEVEHDLEGKK